MSIADDIINGTSSLLALDATYDIKPDVAGGQTQISIKNINVNKAFELYYVDGIDESLAYAETDAAGRLLYNMDFRLTAAHFLRVKAKAANTKVSWDGLHWK